MCGVYVFFDGYGLIVYIGLVVYWVSIGRCGRYIFILCSFIFLFENVFYECKILYCIMCVNIFFNFVILLCNYGMFLYIINIV